MVNGENIKAVEAATYLGDKFNSKGKYTSLARIEWTPGDSWE